MKNRYASRSAQEAIVHDDGTRHCNWCGDFIDPIDWCGWCQHYKAPCARNDGPHRRLRKRADAAFCDRRCRTAFHNDTTGSVGQRRLGPFAA